MISSQKLRFTAVIHQHKGMDAGYIEFPFSVQELFGVKGQVKVRVVFNNHVEYRGSLSKMGHACHLLGITKEIRQQLGKTFGDTLDVELEQDLKTREVPVPDDVIALLRKAPVGLEYFNGLSFSNRKEYITWIESAKKEETRNNRLAVFIEKVSSRKKLGEK